jgi:hypothetical protein
MKGRALDDESSSSSGRGRSSSASASPSLRPTAAPSFSFSASHNAPAHSSSSSSSTSSSASASCLHQLGSYLPSSLNEAAALLPVRLSEALGVGALAHQSKAGGDAAAETHGIVWRNTQRVIQSGQRCVGCGSSDCVRENSCSFIFVE